MKNFIWVLILVIISISKLQSLTLKEAVEKSLLNNDQYQGKIEKYNSDYLNIAVARSFLFPSLDVSGDWSASNNRYSKGDFQSITLSVSQVVFDYSAISYLSQVKLSATKAELELYKETNNIMLQVVEAYLSLNASIEEIGFLKAQALNLEKQMQNLEAKIKVGSARNIDLEEIRAKYQLVQSEIITAENNLLISQDNLRDLTKSDINNRQEFIEVFPSSSLVIASSMEDWLNQVTQSNLDILIGTVSLNISDTDIELSKAAYYPSVNLIGSMSFKDSNFKSKTIAPASQLNPKEESITVSAKINLFQGFKTNNQLQQKKYTKNAILYALEDTKHTVLRQSKSYYMNISSGFSELDALYKSLKASEESYKAMEDSYAAGIRTITDVLTANEQVLNAKRKYLASKNKFILSLLNLKAVSGKLSMQDIADLDIYFAN